MINISMIRSIYFIAANETKNKEKEKPVNVFEKIIKESEKSGNPFFMDNHLSNMLELTPKPIYFDWPLNNYIKPDSLFKDIFYKNLYSKFPSPKLSFGEYIKPKFQEKGFLNSIEFKKIDRLYYDINNDFYRRFLLELEWKRKPAPINVSMPIRGVDPCADLKMIGKLA